MGSLKRDVLDLQKYLPPVALLKMQQRLRAMRGGEILEIRVDSRDLFRDVKRLLLTSRISFRFKKVSNGGWRIHIEK